MSVLPFQKAAIEELTHARDFTRAWQKLVPPSAINTRVTAKGVEYLHPTKGWRKVNAKRFAIY
jgi:hypothetical protein